MKNYKRYETKITSIKRSKDLLFYIINDKYLTSNLKGAEVNDYMQFVFCDSEYYIAILCIKKGNDNREVKIWLDQN